MLDIILMMILKGLKKPIVLLFFLFTLGDALKTKCVGTAHNALVIALFTMHEIQYVGSYVESL